MTGTTWPTFVLSIVLVLVVVFLLLPVALDVLEAVQTLSEAMEVRG